MLQNSSMPSTSFRVKLKNEQGKSNTLPEGKRYFHSTPGSGVHLFLGLGPNPENIPVEVPEHASVFFLESSEFLSQIDKSWHNAVPKKFQQIDRNELVEILAKNPTIHEYMPESRIFPTFWSSVKAQILAQNFQIQSRQTVFLAAEETALIKKELGRAFSQADMLTVSLARMLTAKELYEMICLHSPLFWLSINFSGLDSWGENIALLRECGIPVLVWCVDNPFHLISRFKSELWKECEILLTDGWFVPYLQNFGAKTWHLPLATDPTIFTLCEKKEEKGLFFVGSSSFPGKEKFFAGCRFEKSLAEEAENLLRQGKRPDFEWFLQKQGEVENWFDLQWRQRGFAAESCNLAWRQYVLQTLSERERVQIFGDKNWENLVSKASLHGSVDYYSVLPDLYSRAEFSINLTSLQLPNGLTQRHFDTWAAGGFLLTDRSPGLTLFPSELTNLISFSTPYEALKKIAVLRADSKHKQELKLAWQEEILAHHTYLHRVQRILEIVASCL